MPQGFTQPQSMRAQNLIQSMGKIVLLLQQHGLSSRYRELMRKYLLFITNLLKSSKQASEFQGDSQLSPPVDGWQEELNGVILVSLECVQDLLQVSSENFEETNDACLKSFNQAFMAYGDFWEKFRATQNAQEQAEDSAVENYCYALSTAKNIKSTDMGHRLITESYTKYWNALETRMQRTRTYKDIEALMQALDLSDQLIQSKEAIEMCKITSANLAWMLRLQYPNPDRLREAMHRSREIIQASCEKNKRTTECLQRYSTMHNYILSAARDCNLAFTNQEVFSDLETAVGAAAVAYKGLWPEAPRDIQEQTAKVFGDILVTHYVWTGSFNDLQKALKAAKSAVEKFPCKPDGIDFNWSRCAMILTNLSLYLDMEDHLDEALGFANRALTYYKGIVELPTRWVACEEAICLRLTSIVYRITCRRRFMNRDNQDTLQLAIENADKAVNILLDNDPELSTSVHNQTLVYYTRYMSPYAKHSDLDNAITTATRGVGLGAHNYSNIQRSPRYAERMTVESIALAGEVLAARYLRDGNLSDLDASIHAEEMELKLFPPIHPRRTYALQNYRDRLDLKMRYYFEGGCKVREENLLRRWRFKVSQVSTAELGSVEETDLGLLQSLLKHKRGRLKSTSLDSVQRPRMSAMVLGFEPLYKDFSPITYARGSYSSDLRLSVDKAGLCTQGSSKIRPVEPLSDLELFLTKLSSVTRRELLTEWKDLSLAGLDNPEKLGRIMILGDWMFEHRQWNELHCIWQYCFEATNSLELYEIGKQEYHSAFRRLAILAVKEAAYMLLQGHDVWSIIFVLERGREVLNSLNFSTTQVQRIKYAPHLERQVEELVADMKNPGPERNHEWRRSKFRHLNKFECNSCDMLKAVKDLISCETDFTPFGRENIIRQSQSGPIVMLVATSVGTHAIIITPFQTRAITLDKSVYEDALKRSATARLILKKCEQEQSAVGDANREVRLLLKWLWDAVVHPVVKILGLHPQKSIEKLPRIQWVCCGIFSRLPVHAAGIFTKPKQPHLAQYAISSYLSSVRYTVMAKRNTPYLRPTQSQILVVSMPHTESDGLDHFEDLDTEAESQLISRNLPRSFGTTFLVNPDMGSLESLINGCRIAHFSCHGVINSTNPLKSRLVIRFDAQRALTVAAIRNLRTSFPRLAFLSACHSADYEDESTADEVIHVAKAFQLAGFPSVVGTLWQAFDNDAAGVTGEFYAYLKRQLDRSMANDLGGDLFARALHSAVGSLREKNPYACAGWASWIHYGD